MSTFFPRLKPKTADACHCLRLVVEGEEEAKEEVDEEVAAVANCVGCGMFLLLLLLLTR